MRQKCNLVLREAYRRLEDWELRAAEGGRAANTCKYIVTVA